MSLLLNSIAKTVGSTTSAASQIGAGVKTVSSTTGLSNLNSRGRSLVGSNKAATSVSSVINAKASGTTRPIIYPPDLHSRFGLTFDMGEYVPTQSVETASQRNSGGTTGNFGQQWRSQATIVLPMPPNIADTNDPVWKDFQADLWGGLGNIASNLFGEGGAEGKAADMLKSMGADLGTYGFMHVGAKQLPSLAAVIQNSIGTALNPFIVKSFSGVSFKQHTFNYRFAPRDAREAAIIKSIIRTFQIHSLPTIGSDYAFTLRYPSLFRVKFVHPQLNDALGMFKKFMILDGVSVNYMPNSVSLVKDDKTGEILPTVYNLSLQFAEIQIWTAEDYSGQSSGQNSGLSDLISVFDKSSDLQSLKSDLASNENNEGE